jgi:hypothetical protein
LFNKAFGKTDVSGNATFPFDANDFVCNHISLSPRKEA